MRSKLLLLAGLFFAAFSVKATTVTINAVDMTFSPANVTLNLGDTVKFVHISGGNHTTTSTAVPAGATSWDAPLTDASSTFIYVPAVSGIYSYVCTPHAPGMAGTFTVNPATSISDVAAVNEVFSLYPNPSGNEVYLSLKNNTGKASVAVSDMTGKQVMNVEHTVSGNIRLNVSNLSNGLYFVRLMSDGKTYVKKFAVSR